MQIQENIILAPYTTFKIGGPAKFFCVPKNIKDVKDAVTFARERKLPIFVLGAGSNVLVSDEGFHGLVIHPQIDLYTVKENSDQIFLTLGAGLNWDEIVKMSVEKGWWGIENLSHIPGNCGGLAVQNVGAYGQEAAQVVEAVQAFDITTGQIVKFSNLDCGFTYRHSIFNTTQKGKYIILSTIIKLSKNPGPSLDYGDVKRYFSGKPNPAQAEIRQAIIEIRNKKFPYPREAINGNAGSFFRGPILSPEKFEEIKEIIAQKVGTASAQKLETMRDVLKVSQGFKTPTAFLIEQLGLKGFQIGGAKVNEPQPAIVLNATGTATAADVLSLTGKVFTEVKNVFGIELEVEPEMVGC